MVTDELAQQGWGGGGACPQVCGLDQNAVQGENPILLLFLFLKVNFFFFF